MQVVQEVFCWSRNPVEVRRLCARKEELYSALAGNHQPPVVPGVPLFLDTLVKHNVRTLLFPPLPATGLGVVPRKSIPLLLRSALLLGFAWV